MVVQLYVREYTDWLLSKSISSHFTAFKEGFDLVMGHTHLADLFHPEELEMMICGSNVSYRRGGGGGRNGRDSVLGLFVLREHDQSLFTLIHIACVHLYCYAEKL